MAEFAVEVRHVTKTFKRNSEPAKTLKDRLLTLRDNSVESFNALDDVSFEVEAGETIGILGHNGSGKSTLLKCIAGTLRPTEGSVAVRGRLSALLELGAGFHPDLTGRENVYLNGSILGFSRQRIDQIFDDIVEFSELHDFIDSQVKHYSSGMYARLGFGVAVNLEPDVLLVDEVLAVGDEAFQRKCMERVRGFQNDGRTILLVTHSPEQVRQVCSSSVVLDHGRVLHVGDVGKAVTIYRRSLANKGIVLPDQPDEQEDVPVNEGVVITRTVVVPPSDGRDAFRPGDQVRLQVHYRTAGPVGGIRGRMIMHSHDGVLLYNASTHDIRGGDVVHADGDAMIEFVIDDLPLMDGRYLVSFVLQDQTETFEYARSEQQTAFDVDSGGPITGRVKLKIHVEEHTS
ncbi:MAG: ABC transporter ATP-binding protein [Acidimicrobiales bacterium]